MSFLQPPTFFELFCLVGRTIWGKLRWCRGTHRWNLLSTRQIPYLLIYLRASGEVEMERQTL